MNCFIDRRPSKRKSESETALHGGNGSKADSRQLAEKGKHFDGTPMEQCEIIAWNKDKYNLLINDAKKSFLADCGIALMEVIPRSANREEFISGMKEKGWEVDWTDKRKHIVFQNENGDKVRDTNIEKTFSGLKVNKEALTHEFERQNEIRNSGTPDNGQEREATAALIRDARNDINNSRAQSRAVISAENQSVTRERERRLEEQSRAHEQERAKEAYRRAHRHRGPSR